MSQSLIIILLKLFAALTLCSYLLGFIVIENNKLFKCIIRITIISAILFILTLILTI